MNKIETYGLIFIGLISTFFIIQFFAKAPDPNDKVGRYHPKAEDIQIIHINSDEYGSF